MTSKKNTRRALFMSTMSLILCFAMLMGTTFAWFTDSVTSGNNLINAGNLNVELYHSDKNTPEEKVDAGTKLFDDVIPGLWEPGAVAYENLRVENVGTLALKYDLNLNVLNETVVNGHRLSEVIKVGIVNEKIENADRDAVVAKVTSWTPLNQFSMNMTGKKLEAKRNSGDFGVVLYWQPNSNEIDNLYNMNNDNQGKELKLEIGVTLTATQQMHENDSFGNDYDVNAPYSAWDGTVPAEMPETLVVDGATQTIHVKDAAAFVYLSTLSDKWAELYTDRNGTDVTNYAKGAGADYYYSGKWTVSLESNIDLNNQKIDPIKVVIGQDTGASAFNGNGHVIRNINTTTGLFANDNRVTYSNFALDNVKATNGAVTGTVDNDITNVTVNNATISGGDYVGGLVGYTYGEVINCKVMNSSVTASGKEAGGLIGYVATSGASAEVYNNEVYNVSVHAGNRAAGLVAQANVNVKVHNNTIDTVTVSAEDHKDYKPDAVVSSALAPENVYNNTVKNAKVLEGETAMHPDSGLIWNGESTNHKGVYSIYSADDLKKAVSYFAYQDHSNEGNKVTFELMADIDMAGKTWEPWNVMFITVNGKNHTISNLSNSLFGYAGAVKVNDLTLENVKASGNQAGTFAARTEGATFTNCVLKGNNTVTYVDAGKNENGVGVISGITITSNLNVTIDTDATVTLNKGAIKDTEKTTFESNLYGYKYTAYATNSGTITNNGKLVITQTVADAAELTNALKNGNNVVLTDDVSMEAATTAPYGNKYAVKLDGGVLDGNGNELNVECYGDDYGIMTSGGTVKNLTIKEGCRAVMIMYPTEDIILDNVNIGGDGVLYPINTGEAGPEDVNLIVTNSTLAGWTSYSYIESASFTNVTFKQGTYYDNIYGRVLKPYVNTTLTNCSFVEHMNLDLSDLTDGHKITMANCTVNGQAVTADVFTVPSNDTQYDTELFTVDLPSWATSIDDCIIFR